MMSVGRTVYSSEHNRGGVERDAGEGQRIREILEIGQDGRRHLGRHLCHRGSFRHRVRLIGRRATLRRATTCSRGAPLHVQARSSARHRALSGCQEIQRSMESL